MLISSDSFCSNSEDNRQLFFRIESKGYVDGSYRKRKPQHRQFAATKTIVLFRVVQQKASFDLYALSSVSLQEIKATDTFRLKQLTLI